MRLLLVQYSGDYRAAFEFLQESGQETYHGHRYVLEQLAEMQRDLGAVGVLCCLTPERYRDRLPSGVEVMGAAAHPLRQPWRVIRMIADWDPTHVVVQGPMTAILWWGIHTRRRLLAMMASSFEAQELLLRIKNFGLVSALNHRGVDWVTNHGVNACRSIVRFGVKEQKVIPWDWPHENRVDHVMARRLPDAPHVLLYVGLVSEQKGVGDLIEGMGVLRDRGFSVQLQIVGDGDIEGFRAQAEERGVGDRVEILGLRPNAEVFQRMSTATAVIVPSHRVYPEGLPLTIYEALAARTPIIASDHPMFAGHLRHGETAMVFPERDSSAFADCVAELLGRPELYAQISEASAAVWCGLQNPIKWGDILWRWVSDGAEDRSWLGARTLNRVAPDDSMMIRVEP